MATLLTAQTAATTGGLQTHSGPCTVWVTGAPDGCTVVIQGSPTTNTTDVVKLDHTVMPQAIFVNRTGCCAVDAQGTYSLRAVLSGVGENTSVSVTTTQ